MYKLNLEKKSEEAEIKLPISSGSYKTQGNFRKTPTSSLTMLNIWLCHCHYLVAKSCWTLLWPHGLQHAKLHCLWDFSGKNTGVGRHFLFQGVYLMEPMSSALAGSFLTTEPRRKPCFIDYVKAFDWMDHNKLEYSYRDRNKRSPYLSPGKPVCRPRSNNENQT